MREVERRGGGVIIPEVRKSTPDESSCPPLLASHDRKRYSSVIMTPRHLAMFCLGQLGAIAGGVLLVRVCRKAYLKAIGTSISNFHPMASWFADHGWTLVLIPVVCVLIIPRRGECADGPTTTWLHALPTFAGGGVMVFALWAAWEAVIRMLSPF